MKKILPLGLVILLSGCQMVIEIPESFEDCVKLGGAVMESLPRQCAHEGRTFIEIIKTEDDGSDQVGIANPASVNCEARDGRLEMRKDAEGGEYGVCIFEDGSECEEWAFFRGECIPGNTDDGSEEGGLDVGVVDVQLCEDKCGDGECQEIVCMGEGCPCPESATLCPADCA